MAKFDPMGVVMGAALHSNPIAGMVGAIVAETLRRPDVPIAKEHVGAAAAKVMEAVGVRAGAAGLAGVAGKSRWGSKINWGQFAGPGCSLLAAFGLDLKPPALAGLGVAGQAV